MEDGLEPLTYLDLAEQSLDFSSHLQERSLIFCLCSNTFESVVGYVGMIRAQHVGLMLSAKIDEQKLENLIQSFQPNYLWLPQARLLTIEHTIVFQLGRYQLVKISSGKHEMHTDLALLMGTSGSTGSPMMVRQSSMNLLRNAESISQSLKLSSSDCALTTLPMNYTYGLSIINSQLQVGGGVVMSEATMMDRQFWDQVRDSGVTYFGGVPYSYEMLNRIGVKRLKDSSIRMLTQAGGKLSSELVTKLAMSCKELEIAFHVMYGQTEATARMSVLNSQDVMEHPSSIGQPIPGGMFRIIDLENEAELHAGEVGELEYSGPNVMMGYASSMSDLQKPDELKGVLRTGDLAKVDSDGFYYIVGRRKRFIKLLGNRVNLDDVDNFLTTHGYETASTGNDDHLTINAVNPGEHNSLIDLLSSFLSVHKTVIKVRNVEIIPRSEAGKVLYSMLGED